MGVGGAARLGMCEQSEVSAVDAMPWGPLFLLGWRKRGGEASWGWGRHVGGGEAQLKWLNGQTDQESSHGAAA